MLPSTQGRTHKRIIVVQEPVGVVAAISPWNFPVDIAGIPIVYGLAFGCTTVWKPSELAPLCAELFVDVLHDAGFPPGTVNLVHGRGDVGAKLTRHRDVASVVFTGSVATGEKVAREAGLKNRMLELGGNGPQIVLADANLEAAADAAVMGCFYLAGQVCTAAERVLVHSDVHDRFVELLIERTKQLRIGDPLDEATDMGPMCNAVTLARTQAHIADAVARGADVVHGGGLDGHVPRADDPTGVTSAMAIAQEETFGPVAPIMRFDTLEEAIAIANETEFGLTAAVFTHSLTTPGRLPGAPPRHRAHQRDDQLLGSDGAVRRRKKSGAGRELAGGSPTPSPRPSRSRSTSKSAFLNEREWLGWMKRAGVPAGSQDRLEACSRAGRCPVRHPGPPRAASEPPSRPELGWWSSTTPPAPSTHAPPAECRPIQPRQTPRSFRNALLRTGF